MTVKVLEVRWHHRIINRVQRAKIVRAPVSWATASIPGGGKLLGGLLREHGQDVTPCVPLGPEGPDADGPSR